MAMIDPLLLLMTVLLPGFRGMEDELVELVKYLVNLRWVVIESLTRMLPSEVSFTIRGLGSSY